MSKTLPLDIYSEVTKYLFPLTRARLPLFKRERLFSNIWSYIFKTETWIDQILEITREKLDGEPLPCILGRDLQKVAWGATKGTYLVLLINDYTGDSRHLKRQIFFDSLQSHCYDEANNTVYLLKSGITLHLGDALRRDEQIEITDPREIFRSRRKRLSTSVIYYGDDTIHTIRDDAIGRLQGASMNKKKAVAEVCSIELRFRSGTPVRTVFKSSSKTTKVTNIYKNPRSVDIVGFRKATGELGDKGW
jgi:hypothetical protein